MPVDVHYFRSDPPNFGDEINTLLWQRLVPELQETERDGVLVGIGTILDNHIPQDREVFVFGSGAGLARLPARLHSERFHVLAVRGPLTAALAGLPPDLAITDPALLLQAVYPQLLGLREREVIFVPHYTTAQDAGWKQACALAGVEFVDPSEDVRLVLRKIATARLVIAEAMHAAIVADAFRVPWVPVSSTSHFSTFKWVDWALSLQVPFQPLVLPAVSLRHGCRRFSLRVLAEHCHVDNVRTRGDETDFDSPAVTDLIDLTAHRLSKRVSPSVQWWKLKGAAVHRFILDPAIGALSRKTLRALDERSTSRVAQVFSELAGMKGYLSADERCTARLHLLQGRLEYLKTMLNRTRSHTSHSRKYFREI